MSEAEKKLFLALYAIHKVETKKSALDCIDMDADPLENIVDVRNFNSQYLGKYRSYFPNLALLEKRIDTMTQKFDAFRVSK